MKQKQETLMRERSYFSYLLVALTSMFDWRHPDGFEPKWAEQFLHETGSFAVQKNEKVGCAVAAAPSRAGDLDQYGDGMDIVGTTRGIGIQIKGRLYEDVAICYNNIDRTPDFDLIRYTDMFSEVDKSIMSNVRWSILAPILCASNDKTYKLITEMVDDIMDGKLKTIVSKDIVEALQGGKQDGLYTIDITHPERIKNVQYQSELYDVFMRRFFNKYGLNIQNTSKHAQATVDEVHGLDSVSWVLALDMLEQRKQFCEEANRIWGEDVWGVEFGEPWLTEYKKYLAENTMPMAEVKEAAAEAELAELEVETYEEDVEDTNELPSDEIEDTIESEKTEDEEMVNN